MAEKKKYNSILVSGRKDQTLTYSKYVKDEESGESVKESLDKKVNVTDELTTQQIKDGAITNEKMAADSVGNTNMQDGSVSNEKLEDGSITNEKLAENSITKDKLKDNTIGVEKLDPELRQTINAATGLPEDLVETIQNVDNTLKDHQRQLEDKQSQIDDKQHQITANNEDISLLQTRSTQMEETIKSIAATGGASQATAVTYDNKKSGLTAVNAQAAIDETNTKLSDFADNTEIRNEDGATIKTPFREIVSSEFLHCIVDTEDHFLFGIQLDGSIEWGKGVPAPIRAKLQEIINQCQQDKTDILESINAAKEELSASITALQEGKVDKEEGKSLIEDEVKECFKVIENEEFIHAVIDSDDRLLFGIYRDSGKPYFPLNEMYHVEQNEEFFAVWLDAANHVLFGLRRDGQIIGEIHAVNALKQIISQLQSDLASLQEKVGAIDTNLKELLDVFSLQENPEFLAVEQDAEGKVLSTTNSDGSHYIHNAKSETIPTEFEHIEDPEGRTEITTDAENKVLGYRDREGTRHEKKIIAESISSKEIEDLKQSTSSLDELKAVRYNEIGSIRGFIRDEMFVDFYTCKLFPIKGGDTITIKGANSNCAIAFLTDNILAFNQKPNFSTAEGFNKLIPLGAGQKTIMSPIDARYFYWEASGYETSVGGATDFIPLRFIINGIDYLNPFIDSIATLSKSVSLLEDNHVTNFVSEEDVFFKKVKLLSNKNMLQFFAHSDSHYSDYNSYVFNHARVYAKICESMGFAFQVHLGDVFDNTKNRDSDLLRLSKMCSLWQNSNTPFMYVQGNHETFYGDLTKDEIFGAASVFNKYIEIHRKTDDETSSLYFYFDNDNAKIRCFCLDSCIPSCGYSDKEVEWIKESIESLPSGYGVVMFCHIPFIHEALWKNHTNVPNDSVIREYLKGKVDAELNLIAVIHGHMHWDNVVYSNDLKCPFISVASDEFDGLNKDDVPEGSNPYVPNRSANTFEQYLADSFNIDKDSDKVIAIRFGAGKDRYIHRGTLQLSDSISLPTTSIVPTKWYAKDEGLITIDNEKITKVATGNTILYAENDTEIEFWNIIIS